MKIRVLLLSAVSFMLPLLGFAQVAQNAELSGTVSDPAGKMVAAASLVVRDTQTGVSKVFDDERQRRLLRATAPIEL